MYGEVSKKYYYTFTQHAKYIVKYYLAVMLHKVYMNIVDCIEYWSEIKANFHLASLWSAVVEE